MPRTRPARTPRPPIPATRRGFTMIELVTVVAIIGTLIMLLLPAVQSAREEARRTSCLNNLTQIGIALASYEATYRLLPPGSVDATGPIDDTLTGYRFGWIAQLLPYCERRVVANHLNFSQSVHSLSQYSARLTAINTLICPSEPSLGRGAAGGPLPPFAGSLYAACHHDLDEPIRTDNRGAFPLNGHLRSDAILDGLGTTLFVGEKRDGGNELGWAVGNRGTLRNAGIPFNRTQIPPLASITNLAEPPTDANRDADPDLGSADPTLPLLTPDLYPRVGGFGSRHPTGINFLFGDGSVRLLRIAIDPEVYRRLADRRDGHPISDDQF